MTLTVICTTMQNIDEYIGNGAFRKHMILCSFFRDSNPCVWTTEKIDILVSLFYDYHEFTLYYIVFAYKK